MSTVLALSGKIKAGKSTLGKPFADAVGWDYVSFGDYVRKVTRERGLPESREYWQEVGEELIRTNLEAFCRNVLAQAPNWKPGQPLVIDGIRHIEVNNLLKEVVAPSKYVLALLVVDEQTRKERLYQEGVKQTELIARIESHSTEEQVKTVLPQFADFRINGNEPLPNLIERLKIISSDKPHKVAIPNDNPNIITVVKTIQGMTSSEQREVLARLWSERARKDSNEIWKSIRFGSSLRVISYNPEQERYIGQLQDLLQRGVMARLENESDGTYEIYGQDRTFYVTMTPSREFAALLSSWEMDTPPREIALRGNE